MKLFSFLGRSKRSFFYSIFISLGLIFAIEVLKDYGEKAFLVVIMIASFILIFEIYLNWRLSIKVLRQVDMPIVNAYSLLGHSLNHLFLPLLLIYSFAAFIYFNDDDLVRLVAIFLYMILNLVLFINIRSFYLDEFRVEGETSYVYDVLKLIVYFFGVNVILHLGIIKSFDDWVQGIMLFVFSIIISILILLRESVFDFSAKVYIGIISFASALFFMIAINLNILLLGVNILAFLLFYFGISILHHKIKRTLSWSILGEYLMIFLMTLVLFLGII